MRTQTVPRTSPRQRGYSPAWDRLSRAYRREHPLCEDCQEEGRITPAVDVHHVDPVQNGAPVLVHADNLRSLCRPCHRRRTIAEQGGRIVSGCDENGWPTHAAHPWARRKASPSDLSKPTIPVILVCGAPGAGKSTYARTHAAPGDVIIDLDDILAGLSGMPGHDAPRRYLAAAIEERDRRLKALTHATHGRAWVIMTLADPVERAQWRSALGANCALVLDTPQHECLRRIRTSRAASPRLADMLAACRAWFERHRPAPFDQRLSADNERASHRIECAHNAAVAAPRQHCDP